MLHLTSHFKKFIILVLLEQMLQTLYFKLSYQSITSEDGFIKDILKVIESTYNSA